ncbi:hypothetical protein TD95_001734 [Thielaviopsis punctulata]|uniref:SMODS and SLOG-associating 2TM effector domain-containing protein n=1 Tax=Thielaviopsis punctulata TaxID=72032 RepID=A0A0F4ZAT2_9PEZI|nr:hypothetical protein TD95_001734 [Thielaviopsis punctulata]
MASYTNPLRPGYAAVTSTSYSDDIPPLPPLSALPSAGPEFNPVTLFRCALGINTGLSARESAPVSQCRRHSKGIYQAILCESQHRRRLLFTVKMLLNLCHVAQVIAGALLTALGPAAAAHGRAITALGALNTVLAGVLALIKGQGLSDRLYAQQAAFRRAQDWIEETEALMVAGVVGADREETGRLIETAFGLYNEARELQDFGPKKVADQGARPGLSQGQAVSQGPGQQNNSTAQTQLVSVMAGRV